VVDGFKIKGKTPLNGVIRVSGAKNATVALIPATILATKNISTLCNVPDITDTDNLVNMEKDLLKENRCHREYMLNQCYFKTYVKKIYRAFRYYGYTDKI